MTLTTHLLRLNLADETPVAEADDLTLDLYRDVVLRELERGPLHEDDVVVPLLLLPAPLLLAALLRTLGLPLLGARGLARGDLGGGPGALRTASLDLIDRPLVLVDHLEPHLVGVVAGEGAPLATVHPEVINAKTHTKPGGNFVGFFALLAARAVAEVERDADLARELGVLRAIGWPLLRLSRLLRLLRLLRRLLLRLLRLLRLLLLLLLVLLLFLFTVLLLFVLLLIGEKIGVGSGHEGGVPGLAARGAHEAFLYGCLDLLPVHVGDFPGVEMGLLASEGSSAALADQVHAAEIELHERRQHVGVPG